MAPKTREQYLQDAAGNVEDALNAAVRDAARNMTANAGARSFRRSYQPLIERLNLPTDIGTPESEYSEEQAQQLAAQTLDTLASGLPDEDAEGLLDALQTIVDIYAERTGIDLGDVLDGLPEDATDADIDARIDEAFGPLASLQTDAYSGKLAQAAQALGKPADALAEILDGKTLEKRTVKAADGTEAEVWGIPQGEAFKPLSELRSIQLLGAAEPAAKPTPAPLPTGQRGGTRGP